MRKILMLVLVAIIASSAAVTAKPSTNQDKARARDLLQEASAYEREGAYKKALAAYEEIKSFRPSQRGIDKLIARCQAKVPKDKYTTLGNVESIKENTPDKNSITLKCDRGQVRISFLTKDMVRIHMSPDGKFPEDTLYLDNNGPYHIVTFDWPGTAYKLSDEKTHYRISAGEIAMRIRKKPVHIAFYNQNGKLLVQERDDPEGGGLGFLDEYKFLTMDLPEDEHFFGLGGRGGGIDEARLDKRGRVFEMFPEELEKPHGETGGFPVPWFMSNRGYGIFVDTMEDKAIFRMGTMPDRYTVQIPTGKLDYYFIYGPGFDKLLDRYTDITGKPPLPPKKFFGRHNMGNYVSTQQNTLEACRKFREGGFPCDNIWLHWHFGPKTNSYCGWNYDWHKPNFPDPKKMISEIHKMDFELGNIETICALGGNLLEEADSKAWLHKDGKRLGKNVDHTIPEASRWHADLHTERIVEGVTLWWHDNGERARGHLKNGVPAHTIYPLIWAKSLYEHLGKMGYPGHIIRARAGYAGSQRYMFPWPGDLPAGTEYLYCDLQFMRSCSMSGMPFCSSDMGGYGGRGKEDDENYCRRVAHGMLFFPVASVHWGYNIQRFPWRFTKVTQEIDRIYAGLRYRLLPYIYTYAIQASRTGAPLLRPLVYSDPNDTNTYDREYDFLFGNELLVAPVVEKGADKREVYLPKGKWIHYWTGREYDGGQKVTVDAPIFGKDGLPIFARAGAIIPMMPAMQWIYEKEPDPITLDIYPKENSTARFTMLDAQTQVSDIVSTEFQCAHNAKGIEVTIDKPAMSYELIIHTDKSPASVAAYGKPLTRLENREAYDSASTGWYYGTGCFYGSGTIATLNIKSGKAQKIEIR